MKHIKKSLLLAMAMCFSLGLAACGGSDDNNSNSNSVESSSSVGGTSSEGGNSSEGGDVSLPDVSVDVPDVDDVNGAPVANADEWNTIFRNSLSATNATIVTTASENGTVMESGITMIANGVVYDKWDNKDGTSSYNFFGEVDGKSYHWQSQDGKTWWADEVDRTPADYASVAYELKGMDKMLTFESATWNEETGMYTGDIAIGAYSLKISNGKVVYIAISAGSGMMAGVDCVYQIVYGQTADMTLPKLPTSETPDVPEFPDVDGEELKDEETWRTAWENTNKATNLTANGSMTEVVDGKTNRETAVMMMADGKSYCYYSDEEGIYGYEYYGTVDGRNYCWSSEDNETWKVEELNVDIARFTTGYGIAHGMEQVIDFSQVTYENDYYSYVFNDMTLKIKIADGYIVEFGVIEDDGVTTFTMTYGNATVGELPPLPQIIGEEVKDATEWANALENSMAQNNFICTVKGRSERDGKVTVHTESTTVDNGKVYMESQTVMHSGNGNTALGVPQRTYQGYVNGIAYEWIGTGDSWSVRIIDVVETSSPVEYVGLEDWDFAMAKFDQETGAYAFEKDGQSLKVKVVDGLVAYIELNAGGFFSEFTITYGNANVVLPSLDVSGGQGGSDLVIPELKVPYGEEVNAEVWGKAIADLCATTNFSMQATNTIATPDYSVTAAITMQIADDKGYAVAYTQGYANYSYVGNVDGKNYEWYSMDGKYWECECMGDAYVINGSYFLAEMVSLDLLTFETLSFDKKEGGYRCQINETDYVIIGINDGKVSFLKKFLIENQGGEIAEDTAIYVLSYGDACVGELPPVTNGGQGGNMDKYPSGAEMTQEEWVKAFMNTMNATNYAKYTEKVTYDSEGTKMTEHTAIAYADDAVRQDSNYYTEYKDGNMEGRDYHAIWMIVNGEDKHYLQTEGVWAEEESPIGVEDYFSMRNSLLSNLVNVFDQMQWFEEAGYFYAPELVVRHDNGYSETYLEVCVAFDRGYVSWIAYNTDDGDLKTENNIKYGEFNCVSKDNPLDGDANDNMGDNIDRPGIGDIIIGGEENMDNNQTSDPSYTTSPDNNETDNGEEDPPENDKVIINNQYGY